VDPTRVLPILSLVAIVTVEYGGWALLTFITGREGLSPAQQRFFRDGHAHAGVLLVLSLAYFGYLDRTGFSEGVQWLAGGLLLAGIMAQSGGWFVHMASGDTATPSHGTRLTRTGALLIGPALLLLAAGLATA
jgi:hypothetical protein